MNRNTTCKDIIHKFPIFFNNKLLIEKNFIINYVVRTV